ncbi:galactose-1-phosphate uridylyltransferase [Streptomyces candidus]|uniref:Galactose-1-phosphate uridylyltransferase n=1 Tax=Streptomyces candidus TaxID=67283 RepID=A0A7X0HD81_9ACTN|nr:galactose-1-phosphate uridylyltransferase [Streptomyces candidus]MBB6435438.1 UDPglucose--hexose-1-phosphate uridylyltransferase [Streptomyces candidus]GHH47478.1 galactose-1-phosphate uridylyltransferase [Streptomyces candidus]
MKKTSTRLADGRELLYYDAADDRDRDAHDPRPLTPVATTSEVRRDVLLDEYVAIASHRQDRTYLPPTDACPLCPSREGHRSEIPAADYDVAVFENRFPSLAGDSGRCEVVCFTSDHHSSFADLTEEQAALVLEAWTDRTAELSRLPSVEQVFCFENRGAEIGVTLGHPHGQIYGYPYVTPRTARMLDALRAHAEAHPEAPAGRAVNLFDQVVARERADGSRIVLDTGHWVAFVPYAAHWPYEVHLYPARRVPDLRDLDDAARAEFPAVYLELLRRFDRIFGPDQPPTPYIAAWHQAPVRHPLRGEFALHLELFTIRRTSGKLKVLAGSESGMGAFINDVSPEAAAIRLREVASEK